MTDLVARLRESADQWLNETESRYEAAAEIERLRDLLRRTIHADTYEWCGGLRDEIDAALSGTNGDGIST